MQEAKETVGQNFVWVLIAVLIMGFFVIASQSSDAEKEKDPVFVTASDARSMYKGVNNAPVDIVVYTDFLCPYCAQFANDTMPSIEKEFINTGKAKLEVRPLAMIGVDSSLAAQGAYCAADQGAFWEYHDSLYVYTQREVFDKNVSVRETSALTTQKLADVMQQDSDIDTGVFRNCLSDETHAGIVERATADANSQGVDGTPYIMINGNHIQGLSFDIVSTVIEAQL